MSVESAPLAMLMMSHDRIWLSVIVGSAVLASMLSWLTMLWKMWPSIRTPKEV